MSSEIKAKRATALEEKRRRLEELKARRSQRSLGNSNNSGSGSNAPAAVSASKSGNLDEYIDDLLNSAPPIVPNAPAQSLANDASTPVTTPLRNAIKKVSKIDQMNQKSAQFASPSAANTLPVSPIRKVETFVMSTQTEDDDFPIILDSIADNEGESSSSLNKSTEMQLSMEEEEKEERKSKVDHEPALLTEEEVNAALSSPSFSNFFNSASKKVERLLGAPLLSDLLVDDSIYYTDKESKRDASTSTNKKDNSLISAQASFVFPKWTANRDVTSLDWSPHHRGEIMLASYHMPSSAKSTSGSTALSAVAPNGTSAASLMPRSKTEMTGADGLAILWNLAMPSRPEHIFTCGSPVLSAKFHPTEGSLVVGACYSGQVVVWDVRSGRLPVQRSAWNLLGGNEGAGGHVHPIVGLEALDSGFVTAASDGTVNFWSLANLMEPAETIVVPGANISSLTVAPESQTLLVGDESGSIHAIFPSSSSGGRSSKRTIVKLNSSDQGESDAFGHYGNVTSIATKPALKTDSSVALSKGFARGAHGLVLSCGVDWTTKLWAPAYADKPLLNLLSHSYDYMSDVQWSPVHPSVFATASSNGTLGLWNLATSLDEPITGLQGLLLDRGDNNPSQPSHGVNRIKWSRDGRRIAAACSDTVHVLGMTSELWKPKGNEGAKVMNSLRSRGLIDDDE